MSSPLILMKTTLLTIVGNNINNINDDCISGLNLKVELISGNFIWSVARGRTGHQGPLWAGTGEPFSYVWPHSFFIIPCIDLSCLLRFPLVNRISIFCLLCNNRADWQFGSNPIQWLAGHSETGKVLLQLLGGPLVDKINSESSGRCQSQVNFGTNKFGPS